METMGRGANKFPAASDKAAAVSGRGGQRWENLSNDLLVVIFSRIGVADLIIGVPYVCKAWRKAAREPLCWRRLDFRSWYDIWQRLRCRRDVAVDFVDLLGFAILRGGEFIESIHFPDFADEIDLGYVATRCPQLLYFSIQNPHISVDKFCNAIDKVKCLKGMAVEEHLICCRVLEHVHQCCGNFVELKILSRRIDRHISSVICGCLPNLQKLEITDCMMSRDAILTLLDGLKELEYLDISGYRTSGITGEVIEKASHLKVFRWDSEYDLGKFEYCSNCDEDYPCQTPCVCVLNQVFMGRLANVT